MEVSVQVGDEVEALRVTLTLENAVRGAILAAAGVENTRHAVIWFGETRIEDEDATAEDLGIDDGARLTVIVEREPFVVRPPAPSCTQRLLLSFTFALHAQGWLLDEPAVEGDQSEKHEPQPQPPSTHCRRGAVVLDASSLR